MEKFILDLLFPIHCLGCGQEGEFICPACFKEMPLNKEPPLISPESALAGLVVTSNYDYPLVKQAIHRYKYDFVKDLANPLGQLMIKKLTGHPKIITQESVLISVPLHRKRLRWRGFNQAELLSLEISRNLGIPLANDILLRTKHSLPQVNIKSSKQRKENIKQSFYPNPNFSNSLKNKTVILVDDISTTGATLEECAKILQTLKPKAIWGLVLAKG